MLLQSSKGMRDVEITNGARDRSPKYKRFRVVIVWVGITDGKASENTRKLSRKGG